MTTTAIATSTAMCFFKQSLPEPRAHRRRGRATVGKVRNGRKMAQNARMRNIPPKGLRIPGMKRDLRRGLGEDVDA
jgi:hypothetical protein